MQLQQRLAQFMKVNNVPQSQVAKSIDKSQSTLSLWMQGKYTGDNGQMAQLVQDYLNREQGRMDVNKIVPQWIDTPTGKRMLNLIALTHRDRENGLLYGAAGMGKTTALRRYAELHPNAILLEVTPTYTPAVVLKTIAKKLGVAVSGSLNDLNEAILSRLSGSGRIIMVDEAENLSTRSLEVLRRLQDLAGIGLLLAGTPRLRTNLMGRHGELEQLFSRTTYILDLPSVMADDEMMQICQATLPELSEVLCRNAAQRAKGRLRRLWKIMELADRASQQSGEPISADMLAQAEAMLNKMN